MKGNLRERPWEGGSSFRLREAREKRMVSVEVRAALATLVAFLAAVVCLRDSPEFHPREISPSWFADRVPVL